MFNRNSLLLRLGYLEVANQLLWKVSISKVKTAGINKSVGNLALVKKRTRVLGVMGDSKFFTDPKHLPLKFGSPNDFTKGSLLLLFLAIVM